MNSEEELVKKLEKLFSEKFNNDPKIGFAYYARIGTNLVTREGLITLLKDAGVGNFLTRGIWANKILEIVDTDNDGCISESEFLSVLEK